MLNYLFKNKFKINETFLNFCNKKKVLSKINQKTPFWMNDQIDQDFKFFKQNITTPEKVKKTYERICENPKNIQYHVAAKIPNQQRSSIIHFRIINNKLYKYLHPSNTFINTDVFIEKAFRTLLQITKIPDVDFIYSYWDSTPYALLEKNNYITKNIYDQSPILGNAKFSNPNAKHVILIPDYMSLSHVWHENYCEVVNNKSLFSWNNKIEKAFWRGALSDIIHHNNNHLKSPRLLLSKASLKNTSLIDAKLSTDLNTLDKNIIYSNHVNIIDQLKYKYLPVLDGHSSTYPGFLWRLISGSLALKQQSSHTQWFYNAIKPFKHFLPIDYDMKNIGDVILWAKNNDEKCKNISYLAKEFVEKNLTIEDNYYYLYLVLKNYAKYQKINSVKLLKEIKSSNRWININSRMDLNLKLKLNFIKIP
jgi:hypothetical protein